MVAGKACDGVWGYPPQGKALKDGGLTFKAGPREGEIARLLDGDFTGT